VTTGSGPVLLNGPDWLDDDRTLLFKSCNLCRAQSGNECQSKLSPSIRQHAHARTRSLHSSRLCLLGPCRGDRAHSRLVELSLITGGTSCVVAARPCRRGEQRSCLDPATRRPLVIT